MASTILSKRDGLTAEQRRRLYDSDRYQVRELAEGHWLAQHTEVPATFSLARIAPRTVRVISNTLAEHTVEFAENTFHCTCEDSQRHPERDCKHVAAARAVAHALQVARSRAAGTAIAAAVEADPEMSARAAAGRAAVAGRIETQSTRRLAA